MEEIEIDFGPICRFCLSETNSNISIFDACLINKSVCSQQDTIINFVLKFCRIKENTLQNFPTVVCKDCYQIIRGCYNFSLVCQQSDQSLQECYNKTLNETKYKLNQKKYDVTSNINDADLSTKENINSKQEVVLFQSSDTNKINEKNLSNKKTCLTSVKNLSSVFKLNKIKQKYQKLNSLTQRLKDAQSKLNEDILRSNDILLDIEKRDNSVSKVNFDKPSYSCPKCFKNFKNLKLLKFHLSANHEQFKKVKNNNKFECIKCTYSFFNQQTLFNHYKNIHNDLSFDITNAVQEIQKKFYCFQCTPFKTYITKDELVNHLQTSHKSKNTDLPELGITNSHSNVSLPAINLTEHVKTVDNIKREEKIEKDNKYIINKIENANINLLKESVCAICSPSTSFINEDECLKHKQTCHQKESENVFSEDLSSIHVESPNIPEDDRKQSIPNVPLKVFCKNCDPPSEFTSIKAFVDHINSHGKSDVENWDIETEKLSNDNRADCDDEKKWKCSDCPSTYYRRHSLCYHMKEKHNKSFSVTTVKCPECNESFVTSRRLVQHGISAHGKYFAHFHKVFRRKILRSETDGERAEDDENKMKKFECDICQRKYSCKNSLKRHVLKTHLGQSKTETVVCSHCGKTLSSKLNLKSHIEFVHEALFVSCPICKKKINFRTIGKHYKTHQPNTSAELSGSENQFVCNLCGKALKTKKSFEDHQKLHKNVRDQLCDVCGSGFTTKKFLHLHKKTHEGVKRKKVFGCSQCEKVFSGRHTLNRHLLTHSGEKNFICEICSKCFYTIQELNRHVRYHKKEYRFDCQLCEMRFLDKSRFRHHMMKHRNIRPHKCQFCDKMFIVKRKMNLHMAAKHNVQVKSMKPAWKDPKTYIPLDDLL